MPGLKTKLGRSTILILFVLTTTSALMLPVNPWPRDGWFLSQHQLFGSYLGEDNYTPIAAPSVFYKIIHWLADSWNLGLADEFYMASIAQNFLVFLSVCLIYWSCQKMVVQWVAALLAIIFLFCILSTGLPQAFWSENVVLFLFSALIFLTVKIYFGEVSSHSKFWCKSALSGLIIGALVATRVVPILLIPGLGLLFFRRLCHRKLFQYMTVVSLITAMVLMVMLTSNYLRFGRFELTNSAGRHLWQGVKEIADRALVNSPDYQILKEFNGQVQGKNHWEIQIPIELKRKFGVEKLSDKHAREEIIGALAKEAIFNQPLLYLRKGFEKFVGTIGRRPYKLGFGKRGPHPDPLNTDKPLSPLAVSKLNFPHIFGSITFFVYSFIFKITTWLYPAALFIVLVSYCAFFVSRIRLLPHVVEQNNTTFHQMRCGAPIFFILGIPIALLISFGVWRHRLIFTGLCIVLLVAQTILLHNHAIKYEGQLPDNIRMNGIVYTFSALLFFGSLWLSWQIEANNTRNVLPYLPFLSVMLGMALTFWINILRDCKVFTK